MKQKNHLKSVFWIVLLVAVATTNGCADGSSIVTGRQGPEISISAVTLYLQPPPVYETVGLVEATSVIGVTKQQDMDMAIQEMKRRAAKMGANGVLLQNTQGTSGSNSGTFYSAGTGVGFWSGGYANTASVSGIAIRVPLQQQQRQPLLQPATAAPTLDQLRVEGSIGEKPDGYAVALRITWLDMVNRINAKRSQAYAERAASEGTSVDEAASSGAVQIFAEAPPGTRFLNRSGLWIAK